MVKLTKFKVAEYLGTDELQTLILMRIPGFQRRIYKDLSPNGNPSFSTICKILNAIGCTLLPRRIREKGKA